MVSSLSNLVNNLAARIHKFKFKYGHDNEKCETCGIKYKDCECCFEYTRVKNGFKGYKVCVVKRVMKKKLMKIFKKFFNTFKFSNHDINNFILLLHKVHTHVNTWMIKEKYRETSLPKKEDVYKHLNMEDVTDADYTHAIRVCKGFKVKHLRENYDFYVQSDTLLLIYVFMNFRDI